MQQLLGKGLVLWLGALDQGDGARQRRAVALDYAIGVFLQTKCVALPLFGRHGSGLGGNGPDGKDAVAVGLNCAVNMLGGERCEVELVC